MGPENEGAPAPVPNAEELARWEQRMAAEGMPSEVGEDKGAQALRERMREERGEDGEEAVEVRVRDELRRYWVFRSGRTWNEHRVAAHDIANRLGLSEKSVDESFMQEVADEVSGVERRAQSIVADIQKESGKQAFYDDRVLKKRVMRVLRPECPDFPPEVLDHIVVDAIGRVNPFD